MIYYLKFSIFFGAIIFPFVLLCVIVKSCKKNFCNLFTVSLIVITFKESIFVLIFAILTDNSIKTVSFLLHRYHDNRLESRWLLIC